MTSAADAEPQGQQFKGLPRLGGSGRRRVGEHATWHVDSTTPPPKGRFVALVPGAEAPLMDVTLPGSLRGGARETVARRQLADRLGLALEDVELRPAPIDGGTAAWQAMMMVRKSDIEGWRARIAKQGRSVLALLPDYLALPTSSDVWTIRTEDGEDTLVQARFGPSDGFTAEPAIAALTIAQALEEDGRTLPKAVLRLGPALPELDDALNAALADKSDIERADRIEALPAKLAEPKAFAHGELALNLAQAQRDPRRDIEERLRGALLPAALFMLAGGIWAGATFNDISNLRDEARAAQDRNIALVREAFLPNGPLPEIRLQVIRLIDERRAALATVGPGDEPPLEGLRQAVAVLAGVAEEGVALNYADVQPDGVITLELEAPDFVAMELLLEQMREAGLQVEEGRSFTDDDGSVLADVTLLPRSLSTQSAEDGQ